MIQTIRNNQHCRQHSRTDNQTAMGDWGIRGTRTLRLLCVRGVSVELQRRGGGEAPDRMLQSSFHPESISTDGRRAAAPHDKTIIPSSFIVPFHSLALRMHADGVAATGPQSKYRLVLCAFTVVINNSFELGTRAHTHTLAHSQSSVKQKGLISLLSVPAGTRESTTFTAQRCCGDCHH